VEHCFESPNVIALHGKLAEYFLPGVNELKELRCGYEQRILYPEDFRQYYTEEWGNALCADRCNRGRMVHSAWEGHQFRIFWKKRESPGTAETESVKNMMIWYNL